MLDDNIALLASPALPAAASRSDRLAFINDTRHQVITRGGPTHVDIVLVKVDPPTPEKPSVTEITRSPSKDNTLYASIAGELSNGAGSHLFVGATQGGLERRTVLAFDLSGDIPTGATIEAATLALNMSRGQPGPETVELHRVLANWGEGTSVATGGSGGEGGGGQSTPQDVTWIHRFFESEMWRNQGGDYSDTVSGSMSIIGISSYTWGSTVQMVADVQSWIDDPSTNFGWILVNPEEGRGTAKRFDSKENDDAGKRPVLTIAFTSP